MYLRKNNEKITFLFSFCPLKIFSHGNFFDKINIKMLTKFALFHMFCQTVRKIASDAPIALQNSTVLFYCLKIFYNISVRFVTCSCSGEAIFGREPFI